MRITHTTLYQASQTRLSSLIGDFQEANRVVTTGKKINTLSDNPVGLSRVVDLRSRLDNLSQMSENLKTANTWLSGSETALGGIRNILDDAKVLTIAMNNGSYTTTERTDAIIQVDEMLRQLLDLTNTSVNGQHIFSGTKIDTQPYAFDDPTNPTQAIYSGNDGAFEVKTGKSTNTVVGYAGDDLFDSKTLTVDDTNNKINFRDDGGGGLGPELTATIPSGAYTRQELANAVGAAMTNASTTGAAPNNLTYTVTYNATTEAYTIQNNGTSVRLLWASGANATQSLSPDMGFDGVDVQGNALPSDNPVDWGIFKAFIDLKTYLHATNDTSGIERSMTRLTTQFDNMENAISQIGYKGVSLDLKTNVIEDLNLSYKGQKSDFEDADIIEAISSLQSKESAYQAALASTAKLMKLSLVDYM
jgi:flagellar hook-associated protein 3 FlgL